SDGRRCAACDAAFLRRGGIGTPPRRPLRLARAERDLWRPLRRPARARAGDQAKLLQRDVEAQGAARELSALSAQLDQRAAQTAAHDLHLVADRERALGCYGRAFLARSELGGLLRDRRGLRAAEFGERACKARRSSLRLGEEAAALPAQIVGEAS